MRAEAPALGRLDGIAHGFFGRRGGASAGAFASLNVSLRNADATENALENRRRVVGTLHLAGRQLLIARQVHGTHCHVVEGDVAEAAFDPFVPPEADALATATRSLVLGVTTADCAPVLLADPGAGVVAAAHAGWRGAKDGILDATLAAMRRLGASPERTIAAIGPCIAVESYEVGVEFEAAFLEAEPASSIFFRANAHGKCHFDLAGYCADRLRRLGVGTVERLDLDTFAREEEFFSYRRTTLNGQRHFGLQAAAIALR